jgi:AraC family transcriptional regulator
VDRFAANSYFGKLQRRLQTRHVRVCEYAYAGGSRIGRHAHEQPFLSLLLRGHYRERVGGRADELAGPALVVHASGESHHDEFAEDGALICSIDVPPDWLDAAALRGRSLHRGPQVEAVAMRVMEAMKRDGTAAFEVVDSALLHLVATLLGKSRRQRGAPVWVARVAAFLHEHYAHSLPLAQLAQIAGVHPVHLARHFHQTYRCTIGDYLRALRVDRAVEDLLATDLPLVEIAAAHGFADQSHLSRLVRTQTGRTPGGWRSAARDRAPAT